MDRTGDFSGLGSPVYLASDNPSNVCPWLRWDRNRKAFRKCPLHPPPQAPRGAGGVLLMTLLRVGVRFQTRLFLPWGWRRQVMFRLRSKWGEGAGVRAGPLVGNLA